LFDLYAEANPPPPFPHPPVSSDKKTHLQLIFGCSMCRLRRRGQGGKRVETRREGVKKKKGRESGKWGKKKEDDRKEKRVKDIVQPKKRGV
jgi:hypothetical protein